MTIDDLWWRGNEQEWLQRMDVYLSLVKPDLMELEREMACLNLDSIRRMTPEEWYGFLEQKYFRWKYTAPNRYASTTAHLRRYLVPDTRGELDQIRLQLLSFDPADIGRGLEIATRIRGLGTAGASGLLSLMYPTEFGTVDQFAVKALREVQGLPEATHLIQMNPEGLTVKDGVLLIRIMRRQAAELCRRFSSNAWTPRMVDMVLWTYGR